MSPLTKVMLLRLGRALVVGALLTTVLWVLDVHGVGLKLLGALMLLVGAIAWFTPSMGVRLFDAAVYWVRFWYWRGRHGTHHAFGGIPLDVQEHGAAIWIEAQGLRQALDNWEPDEVFASRMASGRWRREGQRLWLQVDAVIQSLTEVSNRMDPRCIRLRLYLQREVLFPFSERRRRADPDRPPRR